MVNQTQKTQAKLDKIRIEKIKQELSLQKTLPPTPVNIKKSNNFLKRMSKDVQQKIELENELEVSRLRRESINKKELEQLKECTFQPNLEKSGSGRSTGRKNSLQRSLDHVDKLHSWKDKNLKIKHNLQAKLIVEQQNNSNVKLKTLKSTGFPTSSYGELGDFRSPSKKAADYEKDSRVQKELDRLRTADNYSQSPQSSKKQKSPHSARYMQQKKSPKPQPLVVQSFLNHNSKKITENYTSEYSRSRLNNSGNNPPQIVDLEDDYISAFSYNPQQNKKVKGNNVKNDYRVNSTNEKDTSVVGKTKPKTLKYSPVKYQKSKGEVEKVKVVTESPQRKPKGNF